MRRNAISGVALIATAAVATGCLHGDDGWDFNRSPQNREEALRAADDAYETAVSAGVDFRQVGCIYDDRGRGEWVVVVDPSGRRSFRAAASTCPSFESGRAKHAVILDRDGEVRFVR